MSAVPCEASFRDGIRGSKFWVKRFWGLESVAQQWSEVASTGTENHPECPNTFSVKWLPRNSADWSGNTKWKKKKKHRRLQSHSTSEEWGAVYTQTGAAVKQTHQQDIHTHTHRKHSPGICLLCNSISGIEDSFSPSVLHFSFTFTYCSISQIVGWSCDA